MVEIIYIDPKARKNEGLNPINAINLMDIETKFELLEMLYNAQLPSFFEPKRMTISNYKIQEYRASQSSTLSDFLTRNISVPAFFPLTSEEFQKIAHLAAEDSNMYHFFCLLSVGKEE